MIVIPSVGMVAALRSILNKTSGLQEPFTLRLYSNNRTPTNDDVVGDYTTVSGGGYAAIPLDTEDMTVTAGAPSVALYDDFLTYTFTGATDSPGTVYGYYITDTNNVLFIAERFPDPVPFTPNTGSIIRVKPRITGTYEV